eukprot:CAMPEP_0206179270 /NCGR_PEP_ID=MMETSP1474-20131121/66969_1 /ASSEMBLY_ACC=CAM_ASM_001110 /TAXON_ID=97495 /ORGANISM="Imantonia sp., Strain RCC918" /LENGTH=37 /DNA_ID= /DNA_START= /DNA_END= /DNA_ORIENTATION=
MTSAGNPSDYAESRQLQIRTAFADSVGVSVAAVNLTV